MAELERKYGLEKQQMTDNGSQNSDFCPLYSERMQPTGTEYN
jgi:hypothetical protein